jgi:UDP-3-O-[3-hydroxymyristoyl] N-acetylglucosamine deacetylase/3-hydroxyacyl-[acyl-carrier-protein] dehydratase
MSKKQCTLGGEISMSGVGLHTGSSTTMTFKPAEPDTGYRFVRVDLPGSPSVLAVVDNVVEIARGTTIANGEARVYTVEHVLAAMVGMGIDNVLIELDNNEPPVGDGSALPYVEMIQKVGIVEQDAPREELVVTEPIRYFDEQRGTEIVALPNDKYRVTVMVDYNNPALGSQHTGLFDLEREFETEFAPARTFCFLHEVEMLRDQGLIKGGNLDNAIVIVDEDITDAELQAKLKDLGIEENAVLGSSGLLNNKTLRFKNEPARHKLLDMIGDLALIGTRLNAQVLAARPGHASNIEFARMVRKLYQQQKSVRKYQPSPAEGMVFDAQAILKMMPHRYPFLMIDRVTKFDVEQKKITGIKNITFNEPQFMGHFPNRPIFPGVLITEAMAQTGCILLTAYGVDPEQKLVVFTGMNNVKFRGQVTPGDQLVMEMSLDRFRFNIAQLSGKAYVGSTLVAEAELQAAVVDREVVS